MLELALKIESVDEVRLTSRGHISIGKSVMIMLKYIQSIFHGEEHFKEVGIPFLHWFNIVLSGIIYKIPCKDYDEYMQYRVKLESLIDPSDRGKLQCG